MISHITIKDFAIIKELNLDLHPGLNVITGETGAGKSIIIEAISMALGSRADTAYIRRGCDKASISMVADIPENTSKEILEELGISDDSLIIKRELNSQGKNLCRVNGEIVPLSLLSRICRGVCDIHGQYDNQTLLNPENHTGVLDLYGGKEIADVKKIVQESYGRMSFVSAKLRSLRQKSTDSERQRDLYNYELKEIGDAALKPGEDTELEGEIKLLENSEKIFNTLSIVKELLSGGSLSASDNLGTALSDIQEIQDFSPELKKMSETISDVYYLLDDLNQDLRKYRDGIEFSPELLAQKQERQQLVDRLKRKYGGSIQAVLEYEKKAAAAVAAIDNADASQEELEGKFKLYKEEYNLAAGRLRKLRASAAVLLEKEITRELSELNFKDAVFKADIKPAKAGENGTETAEFLISANKGEEPKPLAKIASGGELSRIMLAMKRITGDLDNIPSMIFDEIDTGISGATAGIVGEKLKSIASGRQIICITHLPQIAAKGDYHYRIEKVSDEISTRTTVTPLSEEERVEELARLLSGTEISDAARNQARTLLSK